MSNANADDFNEDEFEDDPNENAVIRDLRKQVKEGKKAIKERDDALAENSKFKANETLRTAGLDKLKESQRNAVLRHVEGQEATVTVLKEAAVELGFIEPDEEDTHSDDAQKAMADAAATAAAGQHKVTDTVTLAEFGSWDMPRRVDFMTRFPDKFAALERGEAVKVS